MTDQPYDSRPDTWAHIHQVQRLLEPVISDLQHRALLHDHPYNDDWSDQDIPF